MATRWGIIGAGLISHDFSVCLQTLPADEHQIVAIGASSLEKANTFARSHGIDKAYGSYVDIAKDPDVEIAYVGLINNFHLKIVKELLEHGKHVLCEKSMGLNAKETKEMVALARSKKLFLMEAIWSRFFPVYQRLREEIAAGTLGQLLQVRASFCRKIDHVERVKNKNLGGGASLDIGIYTIQLASMLFGGRRPLKITATGHTNATGADESVSVGLLYDDGQLATLNYNTKGTGSSDAHILGTKGEAKISDPFWAPTTLTLPGDQVLEMPLPTVGQPMSFSNSQGLVYEAQEVRKCLRAGLLECPLVKLDESILLAEIVDEIVKQVGVEV